MNGARWVTEMADGETGSGSGRVGGVDGAPGGWVLATTGVANGSEVEFSLWESFDELWVDARRLSLVAVGIDMPIGLPSTTPRTADVQARRLLGRRRSSLFWSPPAATVDARDYVEANCASRDHLGMGLSKQAYNLLGKIREVRAALKPADFEVGAMPLAAEVHPELSFAVMASALRGSASTALDSEPCVAAEPLEHAKRHQAGIAERLELLQSCFARMCESAVLSPLAGPPHPTLDDLLDAAAAAWTARRIAISQAIHLGAIDGRVPVDEAGYPLAIVV